jgi:hypothetical protein
MFGYAMIACLGANDAPGSPVPPHRRGALASGGGPFEYGMTT